jgi:hypothetical protein
MAGGPIFLYASGDFKRSMVVSRENDACECLLPRSADRWDKSIDPDHCEEAGILIAARDILRS